MNQLTRKKKIFIVTLAAILFFVYAAFVPSNLSYAGSKESTKKNTIKVAFPVQDGMTEIDENRNYSGYTYDYLMRLAQFTDWQYEFITFDNMSEDEAIMKAMEMVQNGEADIMGCTLKMEGLTDIYDYPEQSYGAVYTTLSVLENNADITETNFMSQNPLRVAVLEQATSRRSELKDYFNSIGASYKEVVCKDTKEQTQALIDGKADAVLMISLSSIKGTKQIARFAPRPFYFVTTKGNKEIKDELDSAIKKVNKNYPYFQSKLFQQYFGDSSGGFLLSDEEQEFIKNNNVIHALYMTDNAPYSEEKNGKPSGILVSVLDDYADKIGAKVEYTPVSSLDKLREYKELSNHYDCVLGTFFCMDKTTQYGMISTNTLFSADVKQYCKRGTTEKSLKDSVVALHKGCGMEASIGEVKEIKWYNSVEDCLKAVDSGECDTGFADSYSLEYAMDKNNILCTSTSYLGTSEDVQIFMLNTGDLNFLSIFNKYINNLDDYKIQSYITENCKVLYPSGIGYFIRSNPLAAWTTIALILALLIFGITMVIFTTKLRKANMKLADASAAKSEFVSRVSHDMRTPLHGILGMANLMKEENDVTKLHNDLENIELSGQYLLRLVNDTLDMNRIEAGKLSVKKVPVMCKEVFENVVLQSKILADERNIHFMADSGNKEGEDWTVILSDQERLEQILMNVISNAIKYTHEGGVVEFKRRIIENNGNSLLDRFTITDNGIGMSEDFIPHLFEPFYQEERMNATRQNGTGLGMSIVKQLVDAMNGTISVKSALNEGTEVTIEIPFDLYVKDDVKKEKTENHFEILKGKNIILCEDHPLNQKIAVALLEKVGMKVTVCDNGLMGIQEFESKETGFYSAILMDIRMPVMDGIEATKKIRACDKADAKEIPIIAMTANAFEDDAKDCKEAGMNEHLSKPYQADELYEVIANCIG